MSPVHLVQTYLLGTPSFGTLDVWHLAAAGPLDRVRRVLGSVDWNVTATSLGILAVAAFVGWLVALLLVRGLGRWARRTDTPIDDAVARHLSGPLRYLLPALLVGALLPALTLPEGLRDGLGHALLIVVLVGIGWSLFKTVRVIEDVLVAYCDEPADDLKARAVRTQVRVFRNVGGFVIIVITLAFVLLTFDRVRQIGAGLLASAGIAGIVLGFAAQRGIATVIAGIQIAISQPIRMDDVVIIEGEWGRIEEINLTYVVLRLWDLRCLIVPVTYFLEKPFQNWTRGSSDLLGSVELHLDYSVPVDALRQEFQRLLESSPLWDKKVCALQVTNTTETSMTLRPLMSAKNASDAWNLRCHIREKLIEFVKTEYPGTLPHVRAQIATPSGSAPA